MVKGKIQNYLNLFHSPPPPAEKGQRGRKYVIIE
jgi:hypothetical protein